MFNSFGIRTMRSVASAVVGPTSTGLLSALSPSTIATASQTYDLVLSPDGKHIYACNNGSNSISQYSRDSITGLLTALSPATVSTDAGPRGITISPDGNFVYTCNYTAGTISQFSRNSTSGLLTPLSPASFTLGSTDYPSKAVISPDGLFLYVTLFITPGHVSWIPRDNTTGLLTSTGAGSVSIGTVGTTTIAMSSDGSVVYGGNYDNVNGGIYTLSRNSSTGAVGLFGAPIITIKDLNGMVISRDGNFLYASDAFNNQLWQFARDNLGQLTALTPNTISNGINYPAGLAISHDDYFLYATSELSNQIYQYQRNLSTGQLTGLSPTYVADGSTYPLSVTISADDAFVYAADFGGTISMFKKN